MHHLFQALARLLAPILAFTTDEAWAFATARTEFAADSVHLQDWPAAPADWIDPALGADMAALLLFRDRVNEAIEPLRAAGRLGKSLDAAVTIHAAGPGDPQRDVLRGTGDFLPEIFIVSQVDCAPADPGGRLPPIAVRPCAESVLARCPRCWRWVPALEHSARRRGMSALRRGTEFL